MNNIKAVVFDFGNVIAFFDFDIFWEKISKGNMELKESNKSKIKPYLEQLELGKIKDDEFISIVNQFANQNFNREQIQSFMTETIFKYNEDLIKYIPELSCRYKIGLLSDISRMEFESTFVKQDFSKYFDILSVSFNTGSYKPDSKPYEDIIQKLKLNPDEIVFIDDHQENIDGAIKAGIKAYLYTQESISILNDLLELQNKS